MSSSNINQSTGFWIWSLNRNKLKVQGVGMTNLDGIIFLYIRLGRNKS